MTDWLTGWKQNIREKKKKFLPREDGEKDRTGAEDMVQEIREMIRTVYGKYDVWLRALGKFSLAFGSLLVIRNFMGFLPVFGQHFNAADSGAAGLFSSVEWNGADLFCCDLRSALWLVISGTGSWRRNPSSGCAFVFWTGTWRSPGLSFDTAGAGSSYPAGSSGGLRSSETPLSAIGIVAGTVSYYGLQSVIGGSFVLGSHL